jgi:hypothetical protein
MCHRPGCRVIGAAGVMGVVYGIDNEGAGLRLDQQHRAGIHQHAVLVRALKVLVTL